MANIIKSIVTRIDTTANWTTLNPTPANGEQCIEILGRGLFKLKIGDGVTPWIALKYATVSSIDEELRQLIINETQERIQADSTLEATKLNKSNEASIIYGTDENGNQTTYDVNSFGNVDDVQVDGVSVVDENKIAHISLADKVEKTTEPLVVYGTDEEGNPTTYSAITFGKVDDVRVNGVSVVDSNKVAQIEPKAVDVEYEIETQPEIETVQDALDNIMNNLYYVNPTGTLTVSNFTDKYEVGSTVSNPFKVTWSLAQGKTVKVVDTTNITFPNGTVYDIMSGETSTWKSGYVYYNNDITSNTDGAEFSFKYYYKDNHSVVPQKEGAKNNFTVTKKCNFYIKYYCGKSTKSSLTDAEIRSLSDSDFCTKQGDILKTFGNYTDTNPFYIYLVLPTKYCNKIMFKQGGFETSDYSMTQRNVENAFGLTNTQYNIYRFKSDSAFEGGSSASVKVEVKNN